ncbi:MAG: hypothetical protein ACTSO7_07940 [Candidatus Heimdallarchaeota archaeon]
MTKIPEQIREKFIETFYDEVKFGILNAIDFYDSVNLKRLAVLVGRPETTTIRHIKKLLDEKLITIDAEKTAKEWGKFYKLSEPVRLLFDERKNRIQNVKIGFMMKLVTLRRKVNKKLKISWLKLFFQKKI